MAHGWLGSVLLLLLPFKTIFDGNFMHSDRLSTDTKINKQQICEYANKPEVISKKDKQHQQQMKCWYGANKQCQRSDLPFTCLVWLLLLIILGSLVLRIPQNEPDSLLCHTPYLNNVGYGRFTIYYSLLKFGNIRVIGLRTKVELGGRKKDNGRAIMYLSFLVLLAGDIQLNPGPDANCAIGEQAGASAAELVRHLRRPADLEVFGLRLERPGPELHPSFRGFFCRRGGGGHAGHGNFRVTAGHGFKITMCARIQRCS